MKWMIILLCALAFACGKDIKKDDPPPCGNGRLDAGEKCDWGIGAGAPGACPTECDSPADSCSSAVLVGQAQSCSAECVINEASCGSGDGCCPVGCDSTNDPDCTNTCGDGVVEGSETCDGNCPTTCDDRDPCTVDSFSGSAETCSLACATTAISACSSGDGCCPSGCTSDDDSDCSSSCGNGILDPGELCDGDCPTDCDDGVACTSDRLVGNPATCNVQCVNDPITVCQGGDGCCPAGCFTSNDSDCACVPLTCADVGWTCGSLDTGCNTTENCGVCSPTQTCDGGTCMDVPADRGIGSACTADTQCNSGLCQTQAAFGYPGGYCVGLCDFFGFSCEGSPPNGVCSGGQCVRGCSSNSDCRTGYECYTALGASVQACHPVGLGAREIGQSCTSSMDCGGGRHTLCRGPADGYLNGYCQRYCDTQNTCPSGSHCSFDSQGIGLCLRNCTSDAGCRGAGADGYKCYDADKNGSLECFVAGTGVGAVGAACEGPWQCAGGSWGRCGNQIVGGFPGGYCSIGCGSGESTCPVGSHCGTVVTTGFCVDDCTTSSQCRFGYTCKDDGVIDACWP